MSYRENGAHGVWTLLRRTFDFRRIKQRGWLITAALLFPLLYVLTYYAMRLLSLPVPGEWHPSPSLGAIFMLFFVATIAFRIISIWMYNNADYSVFAVILMHAAGNTARTGFPGGRSVYEIGDGSVGYSIVILTALLVIALWGPKKLSDFIGKRRFTAIRS